MSNLNHNDLVNKNCSSLESKRYCFLRTNRNVNNKRNKLIPAVQSIHLYFKDKILTFLVFFSKNESLKKLPPPHHFNPLNGASFKQIFMKLGIFKCHTNSKTETLQQKFLTQVKKATVLKI